MFVVVQKVYDDWDGEYQHYLQSFVSRKDAEVYLEFIKEHYPYFKNNYEIIEREVFLFDSSFQIKTKRYFEMEYRMSYRDGKPWGGSTQPRILLLNNVDNPERFTENWEKQNDYIEEEYEGRCDLEYFYIKINLDIPCEKFGFEIDNKMCIDVANVFVKMVEDKRIEGYNEEKMREWINGDDFIEEFLNNWKSKS